MSELTTEQRERKAITELLERRARYFDGAPSHRTWEDAARSYRATIKEIINDGIKRDAAALNDSEEIVQIGRKA